ncbi:MAG: GGDEF domain-containing phosphodiesterase [Sphingomonadales bacterium]|nr:GGDEF domain-containing phosphodiesterase [Sphingomonadales bacterium]
MNELRNPAPGDHGEHEVRDDLTGLPGLDAARARIAQWGLASGDSTVVHGLLLGLQRFETINMAFGEAAGDGALVAVAARLAQFAGDELDGPWIAARGTGGAFLVVANQPCSRERWQLFAEQLADLVSRPIARGAETLRLSPRIALLRALPGEDPDSVLDRLNQTLATARRQQGRRVVWADGEATRAGRTAAQLEADLLKALDRDEIEVVYQPQFALSPQGRAGERLSGAEALARWNHPELGRIGAGALFAVAERADHVVPLSRHVAALALAEAARWPAHLRLSLNVTPAELASWSFAADMMDALRLSGLPADRLTLEVTEQALLADIALAARSLAEIARQGVRIALDDFGAGFCNFRYLKTLPLHYLKLDRSMVDNITEDARDLAVLRAITAMAGALGLEVIAEGIETEAQATAAAREGCGYLQGFLRAQPMAAGEFLTLVSQK